MSRLPTPGQDNGNWGEILNDFLDQSHNSDGSIKESAIPKSTNVTTDGTSDTKVPSVKAVKTYTDSKVGEVTTQLAAIAQDVGELQNTGVDTTARAQLDTIADGTGINDGTIQPEKTSFITKPAITNYFNASAEKTTVFTASEDKIVTGRYLRNGVQTVSAYHSISNKCYIQPGMQLVIPYNANIYTAGYVGNFFGADDNVIAPTGSTNTVKVGTTHWLVTVPNNPLIKYFRFNMHSNLVYWYCIGASSIPETIPEYNYGKYSLQNNIVPNAPYKYYYEPQIQPHILGISGGFGDITWTAEEIITNIYEPLRADNPRYITRQNIGKDASNTYDMWCYVFSPENYEYTVYLQAGAHGYGEAMGYWGLARLIWLIVKEHNTDYYLNMLRHKVRFIVVPISNPWDVTTKGNTYSNVNGINLNRDWTNTPGQQETINIKALLTSYAGEIDFGFDLHTNDGIPGYGGYLLVYPESYPTFTNRMLRINNYLYYAYLSHMKKAFMGNNLNYPANSTIDVNLDPEYERRSETDSLATVSSGMWTTFQIPGATLEHGSYHFSNDKGSSIGLKRAVELYLNHIIQPVINNFKLEKQLHDLVTP